MSVAQPLYDVLRGDARSFAWGDAQQRSFECLRAALLAATGLGTPIAGGGRFIIYADASARVVAGVLAQESTVDGGVVAVRPLQFLSRVLSLTEQNYATTDREMLAVVWMLRKVGVLLIGERVIIYTDHQAVVPLLRSVVPLTGRRARWVGEVLVFNAEFHHRSGESAAMCMVDAFTRQRDAPLGELLHNATLRFLALTGQWRPWMIPCVELLALQCRHHAGTQRSKCDVVQETRYWRRRPWWP